MTCLNGDGWQPALPRKVQGHGREKHPCQSAFCIKETVGTETDGINGQGRSSVITLHHHEGKHRHLLDNCYITAYMACRRSVQYANLHVNMGYTRTGMQAFAGATADEGLLALCDSILDMLHFCPGFQACLTCGEFCRTLIHN